MVQFSRKNNIIIKPEDITDFEGDVGLTLPEDFKTQLRSFNGGIPKSQAYFKVNGREFEFESFYALQSDLEYQSTLLEVYNDTQDFLPPQHLTIGAIAGGDLCINLSDTDNESIYIYFSDAQLEKVASNFTELLNMMYS